MCAKTERVSYKGETVAPRPPVWNTSGIRPEYCEYRQNTALWEVSARPSHGENAAARTRRAPLLGRGRRASNA
eukprot:2758240-Prymnesium_polylepis.1